MADLRIDFDFPDHYKTVDLVKRLGEGSIRALLRLWAFAGKYRSKGVLSGMKPADIAIAARWPEDKADQFVNALITSGFVSKRKNGVYHLHDWENHQGYLYYKTERTSKAKTAAKAKHTKGRSDLASAKTEVEQKSISAKTEIHSKNFSAPIPIPTPTPIPNNIASEVPSVPKPVNVKAPELVRTWEILNFSELRVVVDGPNLWVWIRMLKDLFGESRVEEAVRSMAAWYKKTGVKAPFDSLKARAKLVEWCERSNGSCPSAPTSPLDKIFRDDYRDFYQLPPDKRSGVISTDEVIEFMRGRGRDDALIEYARKQLETAEA